MRFRYGIIFGFIVLCVSGLLVQLRWEPRFGHDDDITSVAFSLDGKCIASAGADRKIRIWNALSGHQVRVLRRQNIANSIAFSPDGETIAIAGFGFQIELWAWKCGQVRNSIRGGKKISATSSVAFSPNGKYLASGGQVCFLKGKPFADTVCLWAAEKGEALFKIPGQADNNHARSVAFSPEGNTLAVGCRDGSVRLFEVPGGTEDCKLEGHLGSVNCVTFSPDGALIAAAADSLWLKVEPSTRSPGERDSDLMKAAIILWDARSRTKKSMVPLGEVWLKCVAFSPTGQILAAGGSSVPSLMFSVGKRRRSWYLSPP